MVDLSCVAESTDISWTDIQLMNSTMSVSDANPELNAQLKQIYYAALEIPECALLRQMGNKILKNGKLATHFIYCTRGRILTHNDPTILRVKLTPEWLDDRQATEEAEARGCMCVSLCKSLRTGIGEGKKYFLPAALSIYVNSLTNDSDDDEDEGDEESSSESEEEVSELDKANAKYMAMVELLTTATTDKQRDRATKGLIETNLTLTRLNNLVIKRQKLMNKNDKKNK